VSGYGVSAARLAQPDVGLITGSEMLDTVRNVCTAVAHIPWIADGDEGYGNAMNVRRTVIDYARAGAAAVMLEDQVTPKRCGHFAGKQVISMQEARLKIRAAAEVRREIGSDILILARTDALEPLGFEQALARVLAFEDEGADIVFVEALRTQEQMRELCRAATRPVMANNFVGGHTPYLAHEQLEEIGFRLVLDPTVIFSAVRGMREHLDCLRNGRSTVEHSVSFSEMRELLGLKRYLEVSSRYEPPGPS
jgi:2-methylisocitrate lyase-like PEP mutase family enzyme